jgi:ABC-type multidrug transport system fused ATPase/permease subunit
LASRLHKTWTLLRPHVGPQKGRLVTVIALGMVLAAVQAAPLLLLNPLWNVVLFPKAEGAAAGKGSKLELLLVRLAGIDPASPPSAFTSGQRTSILFIVVAAALILALVAASAQYGFTWLSRKVGFSLIVDLRMRLARHLMNLSLRYHNQRKFGDLLSRIGADVGTTLEALNVAITDFFQEPFLIVGLFGVALFNAPYPTLGIMVVLPLLLWPVSRLSSKVRRSSTKSLTTLGASVQALSQMFQGVRTVKAFRGEERELQRYQELNDNYLKTSMRMVRHIAMTHTWTAFFSTAGLAVLTLVLGFMTIRLDWFKDDVAMMAFFSAVMLMANHAKSLAKSLTKVQESVGASERLQELLNESADVVERPGARPVHGLGAGLRLENVTFRYPGGEADALHDVSLEIHAGETLALVGASGAGKSTLVDLLARFHDVTAGRITVDGQDLRDLKLGDWTDLYALVGQVPFLFHTTVLENIRYGRPAATQAEVEEAARAAYIHDFIAGLPAGYATDVADMGSRLSGGQRQRITIARALLKAAPLLLLDEATSALDSESEAEVQRALDRLVEGRTVVVIAHRLSTIQKADRIAVLDGGRVVEVGSHAELMRRAGAYARLWDLQKLGVPALVAES